MRKTQKRLLGFLGLTVVAIITAIAIVTPATGVLAISSVTDTITIRVVSGAPDAKFEKPNENIVTTDPIQNYIFNYEGATRVRMALSYTGAEDASISIPNFKIYPNLDNTPGTISDVLDVHAHGLSYGKYILTLYATGPEGAELQYDSVAIEYLPVIASTTQNKDDGLIDINIDSFDDDVETVDIYVDGKFVKTVSKEEFGKTIKISMDGKDSGEYEVQLVAKNANSEELYKPYNMDVEYEGIKIPDTNAPDTGMFFQNVNISKEDYLVTATLMFFIISIVALSVIISGNKRRHLGRRH